MSMVDHGTFSKCNLYHSKCFINILSLQKRSGSNQGSTLRLNYSERESLCLYYLYFLSLILGKKIFLVWQDCQQVTNDIKHRVKQKGKKKRWRKNKLGTMILLGHGNHRLQSIWTRNVLLPFSFSTIWPDAVTPKSLCAFPIQERLNLKNCSKQLACGKHRIQALERHCEESIL